MANSIKIGGFSFDALKIGGSDVDAAYLGDTLVYSGGTTHDYSLDYFTIVSLSNNNAISFQNSAYTTTVTISYSTDNGSTWTDATASQNTTVSLATLNTNDRMLVKGTNDTLGAAYNKFTRFNATGDFNVEGNTMSLLYGDNFSGQTTFVSGNSTWFPMLFSYNTHIINAENLVLPATDLLSPKPTGTNGAYNGMFRGCSNLLTAPQLPAMTLNPSCYASMFEGCTSLRVAPTLPATTLAKNCYQKMFCIDRTNPTQAAMTVAPELPTTTLANKCYMEMFLNNASLTTAQSSIGDSSTTMAASACTYMFQGCTSLTTAPELPATTLAKNCYYGMFFGCTSLNRITCLATDVSASSCTTGWVNGVAATGTFTKAASMTSWTADSVNGIPSGWTVQDYVEPTLVESGDSLANLSATTMRVSTAVTLSETHNVTFGDISSNTYTLLYENGNWYNWRLITDGSYTPSSKTLLTAIDGYYTINFGSEYPCLGADGNEYGQGSIMYAPFDFEIIN